MMHAADEGRVDVVKLLLDRGAKMESVDKVSISTFQWHSDAA